MPAKAPVKHHYVPRFILKQFASNPQYKKKKLFVFDKWEDKIFQSSVNNAGCENHFYDFKVLDKNVSAEFGLAEIDGDAASIFNSIVEKESLADLSDEDKVIIAIFCSIQIARTPQHRAVIETLFTDMFDKVEELWGVREIDGEPELSEEELKAESCMAISGATEFTKHLISKQWLLTKAPANCSFYISDNPIAKQNVVDSGPFWGNLGLACPGIEIYMPLSKKLTLAMFCPTHFEQLDATIDKYNKACAIKPDIAYNAELTEKINMLKSIKTSLSSERLSQRRMTNAKNLNALQVKWSGRFVLFIKK